jgi:hypothetical protein
MGSGLIGSADESSEILASPHTGHHAPSRGCRSSFSSLCRV